MSDSNNPQLGFIHRFIYATNSNDLKGTRDGQKAREKISSTTFLLLHGTGGNEEDLISLAYELDQSAAILSPRGKVLENGVAPRFFRRLTEGVFDVEDLKFRTMN
jgi:phospholipase/carboxylesterase